MSVPTVVEVPVRWSDMDAYGHVNNVQYLRMLEEARVVAFRQWFGQDRSLLDEGVLVSRCEIDYLAPLTFNYRPAAVEMWCSSISAASFDVSYRITQTDPDVVYAIAETTLVTYDLVHERPRRVGDDERAVLQGLLAEPAPLRSHRRRSHRGH